MGRQMITRVLEPWEWSSLVGTDLESYWPHLNRERHAICVVEDAGRIVGHVVIMQTVTAEFLWIAEDHRGKASVFRRLRDIMVREATCLGTPTVLMSAMSKQMNGILAGLGADRLPGDHYVLNVRELEQCLKM